MRWDCATLDINPVFPGIEEIIIIIITAVIIIIIIIIICIDKDSNFWVAIKNGWSDDNKLLVETFIML